MKTYKLTAVFYPDYAPVDLDRTYTITLSDEEIELIETAQAFLNSNRIEGTTMSKFDCVTFGTNDPDDFDIPENDDFRSGTTLILVYEHNLYYRMYSKWDSHDMIEFSMEQV